MLDKKKKLSTGEVARLCSATTASVNNWIKSNKIKAYNTPGGQYRIIVEDLIKFIRVNNMPIPEELKDLIRKKILVIDNDKDNIELLEKIIEKIEEESNIELYIEKNGYDGLITAGDIKPDLIFLNMGISHINTIKLYETLRTTPILKRSIIFLIDKDLLYNKDVYIQTPDEFIDTPLSYNQINVLMQKALNF